MSDSAGGSRYLYQIFANRLKMLRSGPTPDEARILQEHAAYLKELTERGVLGQAAQRITTRLLLGSPLFAPVPRLRRVRSWRTIHS